MRFREKDAETTSKSYRRYWSEYGKTLYDFQELLTRVTRHKRMLDVVTPGFSVIRNNGGIVCSPMYAEELYHDCDHTIARAWSGTFRGRGPIHYERPVSKGLQVSGASLLPASGDLSVMRSTYNNFSRYTDLAIMRAHADVDVSEMAILATAGELPETLKWILSIIKRVKNLTDFFRGRVEIASVLRDLRLNTSLRGTKRDFKQLESYITLLQKRRLRSKKPKVDQSLVDLWLEWRYAIRPLIFDLKNAIAALDKVITSERLIARGKELTKGEEVTSWDVPVDPSDSFRVKGTTKIKESVKARAGCLYVVDAQISSFMDVIGLDQPLESAYELIPYSFMLDWVFSVGDWLNGIFKSSGLSILTSWVTLSVERSETRKVTFAENIPRSDWTWPDQQFELGSSHSVVKWKWREPNPNFPSLPRFDLKLDLAKIIDLGAIGRNTLSGHSTVVARRN